MKSQESTDTFSPQQERVRHYFERNDVPQLLEQLLAELGEKMPRDPIQGIAEWATSKLRLQQISSLSLNGAPPRTPHAPPTPTGAAVRPPSAPSSRPPSATQRQPPLSARWRQKRWTALLIGTESARDLYFDVLVQGLGSGEPEGSPVEEHSRMVRESIRPFFPGKKSIRMVTHKLSSSSSSEAEQQQQQPNSVVVLDPSMTTWSSEKNLFAMSVADVVVLCCDPVTGKLPAMVGAHPVREYVKMALRTGTRGVLVWRSTTNTIKAEEGSADGILASLTSEIPPSAHVAITDVSCPPLLSELLGSINNLPIETVRPERPELQSGIFSSSLASIGSSMEYELECRIDSLDGAEIHVGDLLKCFVTGQRIELSIVTIDLVFSGRQPTQVVRRATNQASGAEEGAMITCIAKGMQSQLSAKGAPTMTLVRVEPISEAVICVAAAQLLSVSVVAPSSDDDDDELDF
ncbi:Hypothetical protein, putative [Bodo saltans]|uniref:Uncharacterized protein n=1 Tax=Bodo saltans TaxID=75058 RepID=A0A0S4J439_BODSA|nr:Hypothetical protein, putative [Bodo saltans]|eukprot:CUG38298.1 Hypothetical protein, putative [Bodo saltans]